MSAAIRHSQLAGNESKSTAGAAEPADSTVHVKAAPDQGLAADHAPESASQAADTTRQRRPRGFAAMDRSLVSAIARKGGKAAHSAGTAHEFTTEEAREAGRKGGRATHATPRETPGATVATPTAETPDRTDGK